MGYFKSIFTSRIRLLGGLGLVGIVGTFAIATWSFIGGDTNSSLNSKISELSKNVYSSFSDNLQGLKDKFINEYSNKFQQTKEDIKVLPTNLSNRYQEGTEKAKQYYTIAEGLAETTNYYLFELWPFIKQAFNYLPNVIEESVSESLQGEEDTERFLSFQKLATIASNSELIPAVKELVDLSTKHQGTLSRMSSNDAHGLMSVIRDLKNDEDEITKWLTKLKENAKEINSDQGENYCTPTKLLTHLIVGKENVNGINAKVKKVKEIINKLKAFKSFLNLEQGEFEKFETSISTLETQSQKTTWVDPCPKS